MRIAATIVGTDRGSFQNVSANVDRLDLAKRIAAATTKNELAADLVVLPAGFVAVAHPQDKQALAEELAALFPHCALLAGLDLERSQLDANLRIAADSHGVLSHTGKHISVAGKDRGPRTGLAGPGYGFWGFFAQHGVVKAGPWQQRTVYPGEPTTDDTARVVKVDGRKVGVLLCGELYNVALRPSLRLLAPDLVVDMGHLSMGRRFTYTLVNLASAIGANVYHAQHVVGWRRDAAKWTATPDEAWAEHGHDWASYEHMPDGNLWAEIKIWTVG